VASNVLLEVVQVRGAGSPGPDRSECADRREARYPDRHRRDRSRARGIPRHRGCGCCLDSPGGLTVAGGISERIKIAGMAASRGVAMSPHSVPTSMCNVGAAAANVVLTEPPHRGGGFALSGLLGGSGDGIRTRERCFVEVLERDFGLRSPSAPVWTRAASWCKRSVPTVEPLWPDMYLTRAR
jgi:hypothetical protein